MCHVCLAVWQNRNSQTFFHTLSLILEQHLILQLYITFACQPPRSVFFPIPHPLKFSPPYFFSFSHPPSSLLRYLLSTLPLHPFVFCTLRKSRRVHSYFTREIVVISAKLAPRGLILCTRRSSIRYTLTWMPYKA